MTEKIIELEKRFRDTYMEAYYHLHKNPEVSYEEKATSAYVAEKLRALPLEKVKTNVGGYGVTAVLRGARSGPVVAIRADMDALSITETTGASFASCNPGVMHACGHDAHTAILLGTAQVLCALKDDLAGSVKFIFQPSEEMTPKGGAPGMIKDGALADPPVDAIIALHVWPSLPTGVIGAQDGTVTAASDHLKIKVIGKSAHASQPNQGVDAVVAASGVMSALQSIVSRSIAPANTAVVTIGTIHGGERYNIIAGEVLLDGTVRTIQPSDTAQMPALIERTACNAAAAYGASAQVDYQRGHPAVVNAPAVAKVCRQAITETLGDTGLAADFPISPAGEDFSYFAREVPGTMAWLGCRPVNVAADVQPPLHNACFLPDPLALPVGVAYFARSVTLLLAALAA